MNTCACAVTLTGSDTKFCVKSTTGSNREYLVDFKTRQCTCGKWQHFQAPCAEVIACGIATGDYTNNLGTFLQQIFHPSAFCKTLRNVCIREEVIPVPIPEEPVILLSDMQLVIDGGVDPQIVQREKMRTSRSDQGELGTDTYYPAKPALVPASGILLPPAEDDVEKYHGNDKRARFKATGGLKKNRGLIEDFMYFHVFCHTIFHVFSCIFHASFTWCRIR